MAENDKPVANDNPAGNDKPVPVWQSFAFLLAIVVALIVVALTLESRGVIDAASFVRVVQSFIH